jgi:hypothetical protein
MGAVIGFGIDRKSREYFIKMYVQIPDFDCDPDTDSDTDYYNGSNTVVLDANDISFRRGVRHRTYMSEKMRA